MMFSLITVSKNSGLILKVCDLKDMLRRVGSCWTIQLDYLGHVGQKVMLDQRSCWTKAFSLFQILLWSNMHNSPTWLGPTWPDKFWVKIDILVQKWVFWTFFDENWDFFIFCQKKTFSGRSFFTFDENVVLSSLILTGCKRRSLSWEKKSDN